MTAAGDDGHDRASREHAPSSVAGHGPGDSHTRDGDDVPGGGDIAMRDGMEGVERGSGSEAGAGPTGNPYRPGKPMRRDRPRAATGLPADGGARDPWRGNQPRPVKARSETEPSAEAAPSREQRKAGESEPFGGGPDGTGAVGRDEPEAV